MKTVDWTKPIQVREQAYADDTETRKDRIHPARLLGTYGNETNPYFVVAYRTPGTKPHDKSEMLITADDHGQIQRGLWVENEPVYSYSGAWYSLNHTRFFYSRRFNSLPDLHSKAKSWGHNILFYIKWDTDGNVVEIILPHLMPMYS